MELSVKLFGVYYNCFHKAHFRYCRNPKSASNNVDQEQKFKVADLGPLIPINGLFSCFSLYKNRIHGFTGRSHDSSLMQEKMAKEKPYVGIFHAAPWDISANVIFSAPIIKSIKNH